MVELSLIILGACSQSLRVSLLLRQILRLHEASDFMSDNITYQKCSLILKSGESKQVEQICSVRL